MNIRKRKALKAKIREDKLKAAQPSVTPAPVVEPAPAPVVKEAVKPKPRHRTRKTTKTTKE
tara:strand:+ start:141 stop:323 length:183 start_codon:yes stop_codon:yes gene_type:complete